MMYISYIFRKMTNSENINLFTLNFYIIVKKILALVVV